MADPSSSSFVSRRLRLRPMQTDRRALAQTQQAIQLRRELLSNRILAEDKGAVIKKLQTTVNNTVQCGSYNICSLKHRPPLSSPTRKAMKSRDLKQLNPTFLMTSATSTRDFAFFSFSSSGIAWKKTQYLAPTLPTSNNFRKNSRKQWLGPWWTSASQASLLVTRFVH